MPSANRSRSMTWTLNNYTPEEIEHIKNGPFKFIVFQHERGAEGTPHLQGYCQLQDAVSFNRWKELISPRAHLEKTKGSPRSNYEYCTKAETREAGTEPFVRGDIPTPGQRTDIEGVYALAKDPTKRLRDIADANGEVFLKFFKGVTATRALFSEPRREPTVVHWLFGPTGTGKSRLAYELAPNAYWKPGGNNWWDGYDPIEHEDIIIDDFRSNLAPFSEILRLFDRYPMQVPVKGGYTNFRPRRIFVTTSKHPNQTWLTTAEEAMDQLLRRLTTVVEFLPGGIKRFHKGTPADIPDAAIVDPLEQAFDEHRAEAQAPGEAQGPPGGGPELEDFVFNDLIDLDLI